MEGMGRTLDPDFNMMAVGQDLVKDLVKSQYSPQRLSRDFMFVAKDVAALFQVLPRQIRWMFRKLNANDFAFEIKSPDLEAIREQLDTNGRRMSLSILVIGLFVAGGIMANHASESQVGDYPLSTVLFFGAAGILMLRLFLKSFK
jgi:ubiquinone biosynthesis protein